MTSPTFNPNETIFLDASFTVLTLTEFLSDLMTDRAVDNEFIENIREQGIEVLQGD
jgi:DeoR/GlpR family transcriptional regulator of sugar metabolism